MKLSSIPFSLWGTLESLCNKPYALSPKGNTEKQLLAFWIPWFPPNTSFWLVWEEQMLLCILQGLQLFLKLLSCGQRQKGSIPSLFEKQVLLASLWWDFLCIQARLTSSVSSQHWEGSYPSFFLHVWNHFKNHSGPNTFTFTCQNKWHCAHKIEVSTSGCYWPSWDRQSKPKRH